MPVRPRVKIVSERTPDPAMFHYSDGTYCYFSLKPIYPTREAAERAWRRDRRPAWLETHRFHLPKAAKVYDGLTDTGWEGLWNTITARRFDVQSVLDALDADARNVEAFIAEHERGARPISDCLAEYLDDLKTLREIATFCGAHADDPRERYGLVVRLGSRYKYGAKGGDAA